MLQKEAKSSPSPPKTTRRAMGVTKFYKSRNMKRILINLPEGTWRAGKDCSLDNNETFTSFFVRALQNEISRHAEKLVEK